MSSSYRISLDNWLKILDVKSERLLDLGGSQLPVINRVKSWSVKEYFIADLPEPHVDSPKPDIEIDINKYFTGLETYDTIFCLEVFEYVYDPVTAIKNISKLLELGGTAWVTFPFLYPTHNPIEDDMLRYTEFAVKKLAEVAKLKIIDIIKRRPETNAIENLWRAERMRAAKGYDHNFTGFIVEMKK